MESYFVELTGIGESHLNKEEINGNKLAIDEALIQCEYSRIRFCSPTSSNHLYSKKRLKQAITHSSISPQCQNLNKRCLTELCSQAKV